MTVSSLRGNDIIILIKETCFPFWVSWQPGGEELTVGDQLKSLYQTAASD